MLRQTIHFASQSKRISAGSKTNIVKYPNCLITLEKIFTSLKNWYIIDFIVDLEIYYRPKFQRAISILSLHMNYTMRSRKPFTESIVL